MQLNDVVHSLDGYSFEEKNTVIGARDIKAPDNDMNYSKYFAKMQYIFRKKSFLFLGFLRKNQRFPHKAIGNLLFSLKIS